MTAFMSQLVAEQAAAIERLTRELAEQKREVHSALLTIDTWMKQSSLLLERALAAEAARDEARAALPTLLEDVARAVEEHTREHREMLAGLFDLPVEPCDFAVIIRAFPLLHNWSSPPEASSHD